MSQSDSKVAKHQDKNQGSQPDASDGDRLIRVRNATEFDFSEVRIFFPDQPRQAVSYGGLERGAISDYKAAGKAYRYAHIEAMAGDRQFVLQPIDYVGEVELPVGKFTYVLSIEADRLGVVLEEDT